MNSHDTCTLTILYAYTGINTSNKKQSSKCDYSTRYEFFLDKFLYTVKTHRLRHPKYRKIRDSQVGVHYYGLWHYVRLIVGRYIIYITLVYKTDI